MKRFFILFLLGLLLFHLSTVEAQTGNTDVTNPTGNSPSSPTDTGDSTPAPPTGGVQINFADIKPCACHKIINNKVKLFSVGYTSYQMNPMYAIKVNENRVGYWDRPCKKKVCVYNEAESACSWKLIESVSAGTSFYCPPRFHAPSTPTSTNPTGS